MGSRLVLLIAAALTGTATAQAESPETPFTPAEASAQAAELYREANHRMSFFCDCGFNDQGEVLESSCGYSRASADRREVPKIDFGK